MVARAEVAEWSLAARSRDGRAVEAASFTRRHGEGAAAVDALRGVSPAIEDSGFVASMGPSGKSTLLHILAGLDRPTSGEVVIDGAFRFDRSSADVPPPARDLPCRAPRPPQGVPL